MRVLYIICSLIFVSGFLDSNASAQLIGDPRCKDNSFTSNKVAELTKAAASIAEKVETVPPDVARYLTEEKNRAVGQNNEARYTVLQQNRFYYPQQFHEDYSVVRQNLDAAASASGKDLARYLVVVLSRLGDLNSSMTDYIRADEVRAKPVQTSASRSQMWFTLPLLKGQVTSFLQCVVSQI